MPFPSLSNRPGRRPSALLTLLILLAVQPPGLAAQDEDAATWRALSPDRSLYLELPGGRVVVELAPEFAPTHVANIRTLARERYFDGLAVIRSQDNYVVQWGDRDGGRSLGSARAALEAELDQPVTDDLPFTPLPDGDVYAPEVGFTLGFPVARAPASARTWIVHCYGAVGVARGTDVDSGSGAQLYVVVGHAPRHLDRNVSVVGRVVHGMEILSTLPRGSGPLGFYQDPETPVPIASVRLGSELPPDERLALEIMRTDSPAFRDRIESRRTRDEDWFVEPTGRVDVCNVGVPTRLPEPQVRGNTTRAADETALSLITDPGEPVRLAWEAVEVWRIGGLDSPISTLRDRGVAVGSASTVFLLDFASFEVSVWRDGGYVRSFGRVGDGPGEWRVPRYVFASSDDRLFVLDTTKRKLLVFSESGDLLMEPMLPDILVDRIQRLRYGRDGIITHVGEFRVERTADGSASATTNGHLIRMPLSAGQFGDRIDTLAHADTVFPRRTTDSNCATGVHDNPVFSPELIWDAWDDAVAFATGPGYLITRLGPEGSRLKIGRDLEPAQATLARASREIGPTDINSRTGRCHVTAEDRALRATWAPTIPWIVDLSLMPTGELMVLRRAEDDPFGRRVDVFGRDGRLEGVVEGDLPWPGQWTDEDEFVTIEVDELDLSYLVKYRLVRR